MKIIKILLLLYSTTVFAQGNLTLKQSIEIGMSNSKNIKIANSKLNSAEAKYEEIKANLLPKLSAGGNLFYLSESPINFNLPSSPGSAANSSNAEGLNAALLNISIDQPLFTGLKLWSLKNSAEYNKKSAEVDILTEKNNLAIKIYKAYWDYYKALQSEKLIEETLKSIDESVKNVESLKKNGMATEADLLKIKNQQAQIELQKIDITNAIELTRSNLNMTLGLDITADTKIKPEQDELFLQIEEFPLLAKEAKENRSEMKSLEYKILAGEEMTTATRADYFPQLFLSGGLYYLNLDGKSSPLSASNSTFWNVGLNFKWTIWNWWNTTAKVTQSQEKVLQARLIKDDISDKIYIEVYRNYLNLKKIKEKIEVINFSIKTTVENLRLTKEMYKNQSATMLDVIDAERNVLKSKTDYLFVLADFNLAKAELDKSVGRELF